MLICECSLHAGQSAEKSMYRDFMAMLLRAYDSSGRDIHSSSDSDTGTFSDGFSDCDYWSGESQSGRETSLRKSAVRQQHALQEQVAGNVGVGAPKPHVASRGMTRRQHGSSETDGIQLQILGTVDDGVLSFGADAQLERDSIEYTTGRRRSQGAVWPKYDVRLRLQSFIRTHESQGYFPRYNERICWHIKLLSTGLRLS